MKSKLKYLEDVTICFTDFAGFSKSAMNLPADELVNALNTQFTCFDRIMERYGLEKIKTIGDSYMFAAGLSNRKRSNPVDAVLAAREMMQSAVWPMRIGLHTGPVIAGVIGIGKPVFDVWGETVNLASRMESSGEANRVNLSATTFSRVKDFVKAQYRGRVKTKDGDELEMHFVDRTLDRPLLARRYNSYFGRRLRACRITGAAAGTLP